MFLRAEIRCHHCARSSGQLECPPVLPLPRRALFCAAGETEPRWVEWRRLRCHWCGGPTFADDLVRVRERQEKMDWTAERPRRGRRPKWLPELEEAAA